MASTLSSPTVSYRRRAQPTWRILASFVVALVVISILVNLGGSSYRESFPSHGIVRSVPQQSAVQVTSRGATATWVQIENAKQGTTAWNLSGVELPGAIEGYADHVSAEQGRTVTLYVSTTATSFHVEAYRMGWYGGTLGRLIWTSPSFQGYKQPSCPRDPDTNTIECHWQPSLTLRPDASWPPGDYLLKITGSASQQSYVPLSLRDDSSHATYLVQNSVTTWQAYNLYGGYDLYQGEGHRGSSFSNRSRVVSFDRPYAFSFGGGAADFIGNELPLVSLVEQEGLDVSYWTDVDLHEQPQLLANHKVLISLGHDEYWSKTMYNAATSARDQGLSLMFLGANAIYRHIRFEPSPLGSDRHEVCYKIASEDPLYGKDNSDVTSNWPDPPDAKPESTLIGDMYDCNPVKAAMTVSDSSGWVFAGTGVKDGDQVQGLVGSEYDRYFPGIPGPRNVEILAHSNLTCRGQSSFSDMTYYTATSGTGVFATGTNLWVGALAEPCPAFSTLCPGSFARQVTTNVLAAFGPGRPGVSHPSLPNWQRLHGYSVAASSVNEQ